MLTARKEALPSGAKAGRAHECRQYYYIRDADEFAALRSLLMHPRAMHPLVHSFRAQVPGQFRWFAVPRRVPRSARSIKKQAGGVQCLRTVLVHASLIQAGYPGVCPGGAASVASAWRAGRRGRAGCTCVARCSPWARPCGGLHARPRRGETYVPQKTHRSASGVTRGRRRHRRWVKRLARGPVLGTRHNSGGPVCRARKQPCAQTPPAAQCDPKQVPLRARGAPKKPDKPRPCLTRVLSCCRSARRSAGRPGCPFPSRSAARPAPQSPGPSACETARRRAAYRT